MSQEQTFTHHGRAFVIQADGWPDDESGTAPMIDLQSWAMGLDQEQTSRLHSALQEEREALVHDMRYNADDPPLTAVRAAQRRAVKTGSGGKNPDGGPPTVVIDAYQETQT